MAKDRPIRVFGETESRNEFEELATALEELYSIINITPETQPYQITLSDGSTQYCNTLLALSELVHTDLADLVNLDQEYFYSEFVVIDHRTYGVFYRVNNWFPN